MKKTLAYLLIILFTATMLYMAYPYILKTVNPEPPLDIVDTETYTYENILIIHLTILVNEPVSTLIYAVKPNYYSLIYTPRGTGYEKVVIMLDLNSDELQRHIEEYGGIYIRMYNPDYGIDSETIVKIE